MNCPRCGSVNHRKDGIVGNRQRHYCKDCRYRYTVEKKSDVKPAETRRMALEMYLEGPGFRAIGRILKISYATVYYLGKRMGRKGISSPKRSMCGYCGIG